jgi:transposase, IS5 family
LPTRLIAGLHYLKHAFGHSDEEVVALWVENPYWQYLCGERFSQHRPPCHPTLLTKWRNRIGEAGCEWLLSMTIQAGVDTKTVNPIDFQSVTVDSTVQEKAVTYPTGGKLYERCRQHLVRLSRRDRIKLRQNYSRKAPKQLKTLVGGAARHRAAIASATRGSQAGF